MNLTVPVTKVDLDSDYITKNVFKQILENDDLLFLSNETKNSLKQYKEYQDKINAKALWKNILIDSICLLKINDSREKLYSDTKGLVGDKEDFLNKFSEIRSISTYGIDEISDYFDDFVDFESVLYGTGEFYRDHIHHVLQVWGLGVGLLWGNSAINIKLSEGFEAKDQNFHFEETGNKSNIISKSELWSMWSIIALCHDLGYPLEKASQVNQKVKKITNHFGRLNFNEMNFNFDILNTFIVDKYLNIISSKTLRDNKKCKNNCEKATDKNDKEETGKCNNEICNKREHHTKIQHKYHDKFSKSLEDFKHGAFSGLLLFKKLTYFLETDYAPDKETLSCEDLRQFYIRKEILRAICGHTCPKIYHLDLNSLSFILILCDELQEWGRPRFEDYISRDTKDSQKTEIKEFATGETTKIHVITTHKKDINNLNRKNIEKHTIREKFKKFHYLLRSAKDDSARKVSLTWEIIFNNQKYIFNFDTNKTSYEMFKATSNEIKDEKDLDAIAFNIYE